MKPRIHLLEKVLRTLLLYSSIIYAILIPIHTASMIVSAGNADTLQFEEIDIKKVETVSINGDVKDIYDFDKEFNQTTDMDGSYDIKPEEFIPNYVKYSEIAQIIFEYRLGIRDSIDELKDSLTDEIYAEMSERKYNIGNKTEVEIFESNFYYPSKYVIKLASHNGDTLIVELDINNNGLVIGVGEYE